MLGTEVVISQALPVESSPKEWARRYVRHGMADILDWLGQPVGPSPDARIESVSDGVRIYVSREAYHRLKEQANG